jgi:hypothetical protein
MNDSLRGLKEIPRLGPFMASQLGSFRKASKVASFIAAWGIAYEALHLGRAITIDEYAEYWRMSQAKAYREYQLYKVVWPRDFSPLRVWRWCKTHGVESRELQLAAAQVMTVNARTLAS